jgi:Ring hydroxylating alpha subunit (catalytic domain)
VSAASSPLGRRDALPKKELPLPKKELRSCRLSVSLGNLCSNLHNYHRRIRRCEDGPDDGTRPGGALRAALGGRRRRLDSALTFFRTASRSSIAFDTQVASEDIALVEAVQRGLDSRAVVQARLMPESEQLVAAFQRRVHEALVR